MHGSADDGKVGHDVRPTNVVARVALTVMLALVAFPGMAGSRALSLEFPTDPVSFREVVVLPFTDGTAMAPALDPAFRSDGALDPASILREPAEPVGPTSRPLVEVPAASAIAVPVWRYDRNASFYGPGFYGRRTACGLALTTTLVGVAHRTLPCGTMVTFRNPASGITVTMPVVDRGPYVSGRIWDLTGGACLALRHCYTGAIYWKFP